MKSNINNMFNYKGIDYKMLFIYGAIAVAIFYIATFPLGRMNAFDVLWWLDIPFHIVGGIIIALIGSVLFASKEGGFKSVKSIFVFVFVIGIVWEVYEYLMFYFGYVVKWGGWSDTIQDVGNDMLGAIIVCYNKFKWLK